MEVRRWGEVLYEADVEKLPGAASGAGLSAVKDVVYLQKQQRRARPDVTKPLQ